MTKFISRKYSLADIVRNNLKFNIPIYQRLYVWDNEIVKVFLTDLKNAFLQDNSKDYFIGSISYVKNEVGGYDLVDGQQRNTTLWLISNVLKHELENYAYINSTEMRLNFSIRHKVTDYFNRLRRSENIDDFKNVEKEKDLINISLAHTQIKTYIDNSENGISERKQEFAHFIYNRVKLICTEVPADTDLTKLFEVINARGVQLRQDEILKAKLLALVIEKHDHKHKASNLSKLWEACADMKGYVGFNLKKLLGKDTTWGKLLNVTGREDSPDITEGKFSSSFFSNFIEDEVHSSKEKNETVSLINILEDKTQAKGQVVEKEEYDDQMLDSIVSFSMLLLHTLRIFLKKNDCPDIPFFSEKRLNEIFKISFFENQELLKKHNHDMAILAIDFLECLWKVKVIFDNSVVKWVTDESEKELNFVKLYFTKKDGKEYPKLDTGEYNSFTALQAMLYHSQEMITQFWLTPYLYYIFNNPGLKANDTFQFLKRLDNKLLSSTLNEGDLRQRTLHLMTDFESESVLFHKKLFTIENKNALGVQFPHYWFYKLEYVLYHEFFNNPKFLEEFSKRHPKNTIYNEVQHKELWKAYRITAKNSVEHISPQTPDSEANRLCHNMLNHYGNLALVTRSINSSYSNNPFNMKRERFKNNLTNNRIDALKLYLIYQNWNVNTWNDDTSEKHQEDMVLILENYFKKNI